MIVVQKNIFFPFSSLLLLLILYTVCLRNIKLTRIFDLSQEWQRNMCTAINNM